MLDTDQEKNDNPFQEVSSVMNHNAKDADATQISIYGAIDYFNLCTLGTDKNYEPCSRATLQEGHCKNQKGKKTC